MFSFNTLMFIVAAIVPVCMLIRVACDIRDAVAPVAPICKPISNHPIEFTQHLEALQQEHSDDSNFVSIIEILKSCEYDYAHADEPIITHSSSVQSEPTIATLALIESWVTDELEETEFSDQCPDLIQLAKSRIKVEIASTVDFAKLTIRELKAIAKERKLKGYGKMLKAELVAALA